MNRTEVFKKAEHDKRVQMTKLRDEVFESFRAKNQMLFDHVWRSIELGISIPPIIMRWDKKKNELAFELRRDLEVPIMPRIETYDQVVKERDQLRQRLAQIQAAR